MAQAVREVLTDPLSDALTEGVENGVGVTLLEDEILTEKDPELHWLTVAETVSELLVLEHAEDEVVMVELGCALFV